MPRPYDSSDPHPIAVTLLFRAQAERESFMRRLEDAPLATLHWRHLTGNPEPIEAAAVLAVEVHPDKWDRINPPPPPLTADQLAPVDPDGTKTAFALARELLAGPNLPIQIAVRCTAGGEDYNCAVGRDGDYALSVAGGDVLQIVGEDPDLFEHLAGEIADPIRAAAEAAAAEAAAAEDAATLRAIEECRNSGLHLTSCDADGYCNLCGEQDA